MRYMITIITVGTPHLSFAEKGINEYLKRLTRFQKVRMVNVKENKKSTEKILKEIGDSFCMLLDDTGTMYSTPELAEFLEHKKNQSQPCCFVIGGADGHDEGVRARADGVWSLSRLTFPHDIATLLCTEALYRSLSVSAGHPYHRA